MTRTATHARRFRHGFTLVELLVVLALISLVAGIAVPTIVRVAAQNRNALRETALDLQEMLRATRVLAQTRNLETAVVYMIGGEQLVTANGSGGFVTYIDGITAARRPSLEELTTAGFRNEADLLDVVSAKYGFQPGILMVPVPVRGPEVRLLRGNGVLFDLQTAQIPEAGGNRLITPAAVNAIEEEMGVVPVFLLDREAFFNPDRAVPRADRVVLVEPRTAVLSPGSTGAGTVLNLSFGNALAFPGHVFRPNGALRTNSSRQRFELIVGASPSADEFEQFLDPWGEDPANQGDRKRLHYRIEVFAALGRVKLGTDLLAGFDS